MDEFLDNTIKIFDDAISTPGKSLLRTSLHKPRSSKMAIRNQTDMDQDRRPNPFDISITVSEQELRQLMANDSRWISEQNPTNLSHTSNISDSRSLLRPQNNVEDIEDRLYFDFFEILQSHHSSQQIFDTLADFIQTCGDILHQLIDAYQKKGKTRLNYLTKVQWLENERNMWRLLYALYLERLNTVPTPEPDILLPQQLTEKRCVENLYKKDALVRECQIVIDWLERNASDQSYNFHQVAHYTDKTIGWENTLHQLKEQTTIAFPSTRPIVQHLDFDAPYRENLPLHDLDTEDDKRLFKQVFYEIRSGKLSEGQNLCFRCGHPWRAALLEGWRLYYDPNYELQDKPDVKLPTEGNPNRDLWKLIAWKTSNNNKLDPYWRASIGILCGNITPVLEICETWEDRLWAHMKVMIDIRVESEIRDTILKKYVEMPEEYWNNRMSLDQIFEKIGNIDDPHYIVNKLLIMDQPAELQSFAKNTVAIKNLSDNRTSLQLLRFLSHLILVFRELGISGNEIMGDSILEIYVSSLISLNLKDLVAFYTATLPHELQIIHYSAFIINITEHEERKIALCNAEQAGLDIEAITKHVVETVRRKEDNVKKTDLSNGVTEQDMIKISSLDWLMFYETQRLEAIQQTNALIRYFLANSKLEGAKLAFNKVKLDSIDLIVSNYGNESLPDNVHNSVREFLCYKAYLDAQESFSEWFHQFHNGKPVPPAPLSKTASFTEQVAHEHRVSQYNADFERWKLTMNHRTKNTKTLLYNVLLFPEDGWLVDGKESSDEGRSMQMKNLREICIPKIVLLLHTVLHEMEEYKECVQLADIIVAENKQLYKVYAKYQLAEILNKICESSIALMNNKKDPWGYDIST